MSAVREHLEKVHGQEPDANLMGKRLGDLPESDAEHYHGWLHRHGTSHSHDDHPVTDLRVPA